MAEKEQKNFVKEYLAELAKRRLDRIMAEKEQKSNPKGKRYTVRYICNPYSVQMFKVDEAMKRRCLEAAAKDELGNLWCEYEDNDEEMCGSDETFHEGDLCCEYEDNDESTFFCPDYDYEWEVLTRERRIDLSVYDEDDNEIFHTNDMNDLCGQQDKDGNFSDFKGLPDGDYLIRFDTIKGSGWEGTFEAEEFDPKKLSFAKSSELDANLPLIEDDVMEVSCLCYDGDSMDDLEFISDNGSYGPYICLFNCKDKNKWEEIKP